MFTHCNIEIFVVYSVICGDCINTYRYIFVLKANVSLVSTDQAPYISTFSVPKLYIIHIVCIQLISKHLM